MPFVRNPTSRFQILHVSSAPLLMWRTSPPTAGFLTLCMAARAPFHSSPLPPVAAPFLPGPPGIPGNSGRKPPAPEPTRKPAAGRDAEASG